MSARPIIPIEDLTCPALEVYRNQKDAWLRARHNPDAASDATGTGLCSGLFMAEGELVVEQLVRSDHEIVSVLLSSARLERLQPLIDQIDPAVPVYVGPPRLLEQIVGFDMHRGVLACGRARPTPPLEHVLERAHTIVAMEDLANHDNVGGIFRCVRALAGASGAVLLTRGCCDPLYRRALRVSIGHALHVPYAWIDDWPEAINRIRGGGFRILALTPATDAVDLRSVARGSRTCLLVGAEGPGLTQAAMESADMCVRIEMDPAVDSLNVTVSAALALHALARE